ncbi:MAG: AAA family ATPase [Myxococcaceae bacterium]|nr:AAA family ATPase [Myxococcaceae bacterium]
MKVVGRQRELATLEKLLQKKGPLAVTLTGEPGIGKTTLARAALARFGDQFEHGAAFVDLTALSGGDPATEGIARALGLARASDVLLAHLKERSLLLVLDEAEAVPSLAAELVELLASSANLKLIITAKKKLGVWGEDGLEVGPLGDAAMLTFPPSLVERVGSSPLVLQLAKPLPLESVPPSPALDVVLKLALAALAQKEREQLALLSAYRGGFDTPHPLLEERGFVVRSGSRFDLLPPVRKAVLDPKAREAHAAHFIALAREVGERLEKAPSAKDLDALDAELPNLRAAAAYLDEKNDAARGLELVVPIARFFDIRAHWADGRRWLEAFSKSPHALRARALNHAGLLAFRQGDLAGAQKLHEAALDIAEPASDRTLVSGSLADALDAVDRLQWCAIYQGRVPEGVALAERGFGLAERLNDPVRLARAKGQRAWALFEQGKRTESEALYAEAVRDLEALPDKVLLAYMNNALAEVHRAKSRMEPARIAYERCLALARELGAKRQQAVTLYNLSLVAKGQGDRKRGLAALFEAIDLSHRLGNRQTLPTDLVALATFAALGGKAKVGARLLGAAEKHIEALGGGIAFADRDDVSSAAGLLRAHLGQAAFDAARDEGRRMTGDAALQLGLQSLK